MFLFLTSSCDNDPMHLAKKRFRRKEFFYLPKKTVFQSREKRFLLKFEELGRSVIAGDTIDHLVLGEIAELRNKRLGRVSF